MALERIPSTSNHAMNLSAMPSENTPMFSSVKQNDAEGLAALNKKVASLMNDGVLPKNVELSAGDMKLESTGSSVNPTLHATLTGKKASDLSFEDLKAIAAATAMLTQQESITVAKIVEPQSSRDDVYRGLSMDIGEAINADMAKVINSIVNDVDPTLDFTVEGSEVRFINFQPSMNQEFITAVRDVAHMLPVESVEMRRFLVEGAKLSNNYSVNPKGQEYAQVLKNAGLTDLICIVQEKAKELNDFMMNADMLRPTQEAKEAKQKRDFHVLTKDDQLGFAF